MTMTQPQTQPQPGQLYGVPGVTLKTEQLEANNGVVATMATATPTNINNLVQFNQTDVVFWWELEFAFAHIWTAGTSALTASPFAPYNLVQESKLRLQNQYQVWHIFSGIDAAIFQLIRPMRGNATQTTNLDANPAGSWDSTNANRGWANSSIPQSNQNATTNFTTGAIVSTFTLDVPACMFFDVYYDMAMDGTILSPPHRAIVSPQYMAGSARVIQPQIQLAAGSVSALDSGPVNIGTGTGTFSGNLTLGVRRVGIYSNPDSATLPVVYNWQYGRDVTQVGLAGVQIKDIPIPTNGQIMAVFVRLWDPLANGGLGAPITVSNITKCELRFGSGLLKFQDTPKSVQRRFLRQHGVVLPQGVIAWDLAQDEYGRVTNCDCLNTLTTSAVLVHLEFTGALSAAAYAVLGVEYLSYVI